MTDQEIDLLSTAIATKIAAVLDARLDKPLPRAPSIYEPILDAESLRAKRMLDAVHMAPKKRGWPKGKKRKP